MKTSCSWNFNQNTCQNSSKTVLHTSGKCSEEVEKRKRCKKASNIDQIEKELGVRPLDRYEQQLLDRLKRDIWDT